MASNESVKKVLTVAVSLCLVCSVVVSSAAVLLKDAQEANKARDMKSNILAAAGLLEKGVSIEQQFENVETQVVNFETGEFTDAVDPANYEQRKAAAAPETSEMLTSEEDIVGISRKEKYGLVYLVYDGGEVSKVILPIRGYGLWSTLYGFLALESDLNTVAGIGFYEHGETPGLGGEVDNPLWKAKWVGKKVYDDSWTTPELEVVKGEAPAGSNYKVDGLSGATLTTKGVDNIIEFWLGSQGYAEFLANLRKGEA